MRVLVRDMVKVDTIAVDGEIVERRRTLDDLDPVRNEIFGIPGDDPFFECVDGCYIFALGDGYCDSECNVSGCNYDNGDCA